MNNDAVNDATNQIVTLNNEATPEAAGFASISPVVPSAVATAVVPDTHFL